MNSIEYGRFEFQRLAFFMITLYIESGESIHVRAADVFEKIVFSSRLLSE